MTNQPRTLTGDDRRRAIESLSCLAHHAARKVGHWSLEHADLVQIGLVAIIEAVDAFDPGRGVPLRPYAATRVKWALFDAIQQAVTCQPMQGTLPHEALTVDRDETGDPAQAEDYSDLWDAVEQLPRREQTLLSYCFGLDGSPPLKVHEAAEKINRSSSTVSLSNARSLRTLRMALAHSA